MQWHEDTTHWDSSAFCKTSIVLKLLRRAGHTQLWDNVVICSDSSAPSSNTCEHWGSGIKYTINEWYMKLQGAYFSAHIAVAALHNMQCTMDCSILENQNIFHSCLLVRPFHPINWKCTLKIQIHIDCTDLEMTLKGHLDMESFFFIPSLFFTFSCHSYLRDTNAHPFFVTKIPVIVFTDTISFKAFIALRCSVFPIWNEIIHPEKNSTLCCTGRCQRHILTVNSPIFYFLIKNTRGAFQARAELEWDV